MSSVSGSDVRYERKWWVLGAVCIALFMALLDGTVVNVSIPAISEGLGATFADAEWVLNAYTLVFASLLVTFGRLGDMFGRKRFFIAGLVLFGTGSLLCGLSVTPAMLIGSRVVQALGGAFMMPATLSLTAVNFPPEQRGMAMGIWGAVSGLASAAGPLLGGWLTDAFSWNYIFFINIPIVLVAIPFALWAIPESRDERPHSIDIPGVLLSILVLASLCYGLIEGPKLGWTSPEVLGLFAVAAVTLVLFVIVERRAGEPIMDLRLFRSPAFSAGNASGAILMFGMLGMFFLLPVYLQAQLGYTAIQTGLTLTPLSGAILVAAPLAGRISDKIGSRWLVFTGMSVAAGAVFWASFLPMSAGWQWMAAPLALAGLGMGLVMPSMTSAVMSVAPKGEEGAASGILSTMRQVGGVFGVAVLGAIFATTMTASMVDATERMQGLPDEAVPYVTEIIESSGSQMGMGGMDMESLRDSIPAATMRPLIEQAVSEAATEHLPAPIQEPVVAAIMAEVDKGASLEGDDMIAALAPLMQQMPPGAASGDPSMFASFGTAVGDNIQEAFVGLGEGFAKAAEESFVVAVRRSLKVASVVLLAGALLSLLMKPEDSQVPVVELR